MGRLWIAPTHTRHVLAASSVTAWRLFRAMCLKSASARACAETYSVELPFALALGQVLSYTPRCATTRPVQSSCPQVDRNRRNACQRPCWPESARLGQHRNILGGIVAKVGQTGPKLTPLWPNSARPRPRAVRVWSRSGPSPGQFGRPTRSEHKQHRASRSTVAGEAQEQHREARLVAPYRRDPCSPKPKS